MKTPESKAGKFDISLSVNEVDFIVITLLSEKAMSMSRHLQGYEGPEPYTYLLRQNHNSLKLINDVVRYKNLAVKSPKGFRWQQDEGETITQHIVLQVRDRNLDEMDIFVTDRADLAGYYYEELAVAQGFRRCSDREGWDVYRQAFDHWNATRQSTISVKWMIKPLNQWP